MTSPPVHVMFEVGTRGPAGIPGPRTCGDGARFEDPKSVSSNPGRDFRCRESRSGVPLLFEKAWKIFFRGARGCRRKFIGEWLWLFLGLGARGVFQEENRSIDRVRLEKSPPKTKESWLVLFGWQRFFYSCQSRLWTLSWWSGWSFFSSPGVLCFRKKNSTWRRSFLLARLTAWQAGHRWTLKYRAKQK